MCVLSDCPPFTGSIEDFLCANQAFKVKGTVRWVDALFVIEVRDAVTAKAGTAGKRVAL